LIVGQILTQTPTGWCDFTPVSLGKCPLIYDLIINFFHQDGNSRMANNKIPNLFLVGYPKTGTTSLFSILSKHHNVCSSKLKEPGDCKELKNFDKIHQEQYQEYLNNFNHCEHETYLMEGSTQYILHQHSALKIKNFNPEAKIIIGLREPISYISYSASK